MQRHDIPRANVVGHSDIAPARKEDPGELFDWPLLARHGWRCRVPKLALGDPFDNAGAFYLALERFGYDITDGRAAVARVPAALAARAGSTARSTARSARSLFELLLGTRPRTC